MSNLRSIIHRLILSLALAVSVSPLCFATSQQNIAKAQTVKPITGLIINQTNSYLAHSFYQAFCLAWHEHRGSDQFTIELRETHSARSGRQVQVVYDNRIAYVATLATGHTNISDLASNAASFSFNQVQQIAIQNLAPPSPDLAFDEI